MRLWYGENRHNRRQPFWRQEQKSSNVFPTVPVSPALRAARKNRVGRVVLVVSVVGVAWKSRRPPRSVSRRIIVTQVRVRWVKKPQSYLEQLGPYTLRRWPCSTRAERSRPLGVVYYGRSKRLRFPLALLLLLLLFFNVTCYRVLLCTYILREKYNTRPW